MGAASLPQCLLVWWSSSVEDGLAGGEPVVDPSGMALMMLGGWSLSLWMYFKTVPGFMYIVQSIGLCEDFQGHIQVLHRLLVGLRSGDLQPVGGRDPADLLFGDLVLQLGEPTGGQEVVLVQAHIEALAL